MSTVPLKLGYLFQYESPDFRKTTATALHMKAIINRFRHRGHQVRMVTYDDKSPVWSDDLTHWQPADIGLCGRRGFKYVESALRGMQTRLSFPYFNVFESFRFSEACLAVLTSYDALYERYWLLNYGGLIAAKRLGIPLILEINGDLFKEYDQLGIDLSAAQWKAIRLINRVLLRNASHVVTVSETLRQTLLDRWQLDPQRITAVPNGAHVDLFTPSQNSDAVRARLGLNGEPVVMFIGSFKPWHAIDLLVEAFVHVATSETCAKLVLVGDGPVRPEVERLVETYGLRDRVIFTGRVPHDDIASLLSTAQITVLPHRPTEAAMSGSPMKLFEYMAAGTAIVAPALPNIVPILSDRHTGLLVEPDQPDALARALLELLKDEQLRTTLGNAAHQQARQKHSWDQTAARIETIIRTEINR